MAQSVGRGWGSSTEKSPVFEKALIPQNEDLHFLVLSLTLFATISKSPHLSRLLPTSISSPGLVGMKGNYRCASLLLTKKNYTDMWYYINIIGICYHD